MSPETKPYSEPHTHMENFSSSPKQGLSCWDVTGWPVMFTELYPNAIWESVRCVTMALCPVLVEFTNIDIVYVSNFRKMYF